MANETCIHCSIEVSGPGFEASEGLFCCQRCYERSVELKKAVGEREEGYFAAIDALVSALDAREHETGGHSQRVSRYTHFLSKKLELPEAECLTICRGALLHDIGKIGIPDDILLKGDELNQEEWQVMKQHPEIGRKILSNIEYLRPVTAIVYAHHERYDGSGYPEGLKGNTIPVGARLFAIVDMVDAITSNRPYQKKRPFEDACEIAKKETGTHFDPKMVSLFLAHLEEFKEKFELE